jgi:arylsulfatase A-like enzyme
MKPPNILFITLDQFRADSLSCAGHGVVQTPHLDSLAAQGVRFGRHYSQAAPCSPGRAALYTGTYMMNNRVVANGTPLDDRFDNVALAARRQGYDPVLFGYTDQGVDPRTITDSADPRLSTYESILPGFREVLHLPEPAVGWLQCLEELGYENIGDTHSALSSENERPAQHSITTFLTNTFLHWLHETNESLPWFAHLSYLRPHPPFVAAGEWSKKYEPASCADAIGIPDNRHWLHEVLLQHEATRAPQARAELQQVKSQYYGNISHADEQLGRIFEELKRRGEWENTVVVLTSDHGEQLGDQGLLNKAGFFESSYHIGCIVRAPQLSDAHGLVVDEFTENIDIFPTLCELMGAAIPAQCDGMSLSSFLHNETPVRWREAATYEWDWRDVLIGIHPEHDAYKWPYDRRLEESHLTVRRSRNYAYVHFGDGSWLCFAVGEDPTWNTTTEEAAIVLREAQAMLTWRANHTERTLTGMLLEDGGIGRLPTGFSSE